MADWVQALPERLRTPEQRRTLMTVLVSTVIFSLSAHGFLFTNEFFSHDSISYFTYSTGTPEFYTGIGRFLIPVYELGKGAVAAPWLIGLLFTVWMTLTALVLVRLFRIRSRAGQILLSGLLVTNLSLTLTGATYVYCMDEYALSLLLAAAAVWCFERGGRCLAAGAALLAASLAIYQAYFTVAASLCLLLVMLHLAEGETPARAVRRGFTYLGLLAGSFLAYYGLWTVLCSLLGIAKRRVEESVLGGGLAQLGTLILEANVEYFRSLFDGTGVLGWLMPAVHGALILILAVRLVQLCWNRELRPGSRLLLLALACLIPTAFRSAMILMAGEATQLMTFAGELLYLLPLVVLEPGRRPGRGQSWLRLAALALLGCVLWQHVVYANQAYMEKELDKSATIALAARVLDRIEETEGYAPGETPVAFVGTVLNNDFLNRERDEFVVFRKTVGFWGSYCATYNLGRYLTDYLNYPLVWDTETEFSENPEVLEMQDFPAEDSVAMVDGTVVVKLS